MLLFYCNRKQTGGLHGLQIHKTGGIIDILVIIKRSEQPKGLLIRKQLLFRCLGCVCVCLCVCVCVSVSVSKDIYIYIYIYIYTYIYLKFPSHPCGWYVCLLQPQVIYQRLGSLRVLHRSQP